MELNRTDFPTRLTLELSGARFCASDLNAKLDLGDETEEWHGLTTSALSKAGRVTVGPTCRVLENHTL